MRSLWSHILDGAIGAMMGFIIASLAYWRFNRWLNAPLDAEIEYELQRIELADYQSRMEQECRVDHNRDTER